MVQLEWLTLHAGSIREPNADKLLNRTGPASPPQGRTVRAAPALPPVGRRLLFTPKFTPKRDDDRYALMMIRRATS